MLPGGHGLEGPAKQNGLFGVELHPPPSSFIGRTAAVANRLQMRPTALLHALSESFADFVGQVG
jgi:hypothetical protein